ncbi:MAG: GNAT family N-acetyltransferase [Actinomycetes bacterium]
MKTSPSAAVRSDREVDRVTTSSSLVARSGDDVFVRCSFPLEQQVEGWALGTGVAWFTASARRRGTGWVTVIADTPVVPSLLQAAAGSLGAGLSGVTVPAAALPHLAAGLRPTDYNLWDWFFTVTPPPYQAGEDAVGWAEATDEPAIAALLDTDSPRHSARPGDPHVIRWCVIRGADDDRSSLLACAALTEHSPGVAHLAGIVTRADQRGRGLGRAVTAWITRQVLAGGAPLVTLGMYADNDAARRVYRDLGYVEAHQFGSGYLPGRRPPGEADPVHDEAD